MRRALLLAAGVAMLAAFPATHDAMAGDRADRVRVCHNTQLIRRARQRCRVVCDDGTPARGYRVVGLFQGRVIGVNANAVAAHLAHGDSLRFRANARRICRFPRVLRRCNARCGGSDRPDGGDSR